jgi:hypothetical protein
MTHDYKSQLENPTQWEAECRLVGRLSHLCVRSFPVPSLFLLRQKQQRTQGKDKGQMTRVWQPRGERVMGRTANHGKRQRWPAGRQVHRPIKSPKKVPGKRNGWRALRAPQRPIRQAPKPMPEVAAYHVHGLDHVRFHFHHFSGPCPCLRHGLLLFFLFLFAGVR